MAFRNVVDVATLCDAPTARNSNWTKQTARSDAPGYTPHAAAAATAATTTTKHAKHTRFPVNATGDVRLRSVASWSNFGRPRTPYTGRCGAADDDLLHTHAHNH
jgi:hypothetical protein